MPESLRKCTGNRKRIVTFLGILLFLGMILFSVYFEAGESRHVCSGENCPVCAMLLQCEKTIRHIDNHPDKTAVFFRIVKLMTVSVQAVLASRVPADLIAWKVRLNP